MQIHELPSYSGEPETTDVFPLDTGTHTFKLPFSGLGEAVITKATATISGTVQTVKAAIEALTTRMSSQESKTSTAFKRVSYTLSDVTLAAGATKTFTAAEVGVSAPSGYVAIGADQIQTSSQCSIGTFNLRATGTNPFLAIKNNSSSSTTINTMYIRVTYARSNMFSS